MEIVSGHTFLGEAIMLDGKHFRDCTLNDCELTYGGGVVIFERTLIAGCSYMFGGQAGRTVDLLKAVGILGERSSAELDAEGPIN